METDFVLCDMVLLPSPSKSVDNRERQGNAWVVSVHGGDFEFSKRAGSGEKGDYKIVC